MASGNSSTFPIWSKWVCEAATYFTSDGLRPSSWSWEAKRAREPPACKGAATLRQRGDLVADAGLPHHVPARVLDQITVRDVVDRLAHVHARRPARDVVGVALPALDDVEALDRTPALLPECEPGPCRQPHDERNAET